ncbi:MAG TPA: AraC family transcriptional regulator [Rhizomicrobium sp.]|nr:AraC family transcriptional regulator [Rhizomicrobium sp.]
MSAGPDILPSLAKLLENARKEFDADREVAKALLVRAASLLRVEIDRQATDPSPLHKTGGLAAWQMRRLNVFIEARLEQPIHLKELSAISKLSTAYFSRAFKLTFRETPHAYIVRRRLERAETLMLTTDLLLSDIAARCGFADQAHLCRLFRQQYAKSPAAWRRERTDTRGHRADRDLRMTNMVSMVGANDVELR